MKHYNLVTVIIRHSHVYGNPSDNINNLWIKSEKSHLISVSELTSVNEESEDSCAKGTILSSRKKTLA